MPDISESLFRLSLRCVRLVHSVLFSRANGVIQVAQCYPKETAEFPSQISSLLLESYGTLSPDTRKSLVQNLVMLRNKDVITSITYVPLLLVGL